MNPILYAIPIFMATVALEAVLAWRLRGNRIADAAGGTRAIYQFADAVGSLQIGLLSRIAAAFPRLLTVGLYILAYQQFAVMEWDKSNPLAWVAAVVVYDFFYYWKHRANHEVRIMWAGHVTHHNSEHFNLSTALRQSSTTFVFDWMFYLPMAVLGVPPEMWVTAALIDLLYQYWTHTELIGRLGWFDRVFVSPSNHRVHHGQNDYCIDRNYGGIFIIWDRLFGTFQEERDEEPVVYGIRKPLRSYNAVWGNLHVWKELFTHSWRALRRGNASGAIAVFFAPPAGWGQHVEHLDTKTVVRFDTATPRTVRMYALVQYGVFSLYATHFIAVAPELSLGIRLLYAGVIAAGALSVGWLLEGRKFALPVEALRLALMGGAFFLLPTWFGWVPTPQVKMAVLALLATSLAWLGVGRVKVPEARASS